MENPKIKHKHPLRKRILGLVLRIVLALLLLEFLVYFGSNIFLAKYAQRKINEATKDVYLVEFNRINMSLLRRGFYLDGLVMHPANPDVHLDNQALFDFTLDQVGITGLWFDFFEKEFTISKIHLDNPSIKMDLPPNYQRPEPRKKTGKTASPIKLLEEEIQKSVRKMRLAGLKIKEVEISHANVFFFNFLSQGSLKAANTKLLVKDIDLTTQQDWKTPFNAKGFQFELDGVSFPLPDGIHYILADRVFISSLENLVDIKKFSLHSDRSKDSKVYYDVELDKLLLGNVDLNRAFMTSELFIDELILNGPNLRVASNPLSKSDSTASGDLNDLIKGNLNSIQIKELAINNGKFSKSQISDSLKNRIEIDELNFKMIQFYLGEDSLRKANQFFYGEDASMEIAGGRLYLGDEVHLIQGEKISVSSFKDNMLVSNLTITPRPGAEEAIAPPHLIELTLPEFSLEKIDLKRLYNEGVFSVQEVLLNQPQVEFIELDNAKDSKEGASMSQVISGFLNQADVGRFEVKDGTIQFKDERGRRSNDIGFDTFSFILEGLEVNPDQKLPFQEQFKTEEIYLSLDNYQLQLRDNLHLIFAENLKVDSKNHLLEVKNLQIKPQSKDQIQTLLDTYGKTSAIDFSVPLFRAEGIDIKSAFLNQELRIGKISLPEPEFEISNYRVRENKKEAPKSTEDVRGLLLGYFNFVKIDSVNLERGKISYQSSVENKKTSFEEDNLSLKLKNFFLDPRDTTFTGKTLFSEEIDLTFSNYSFNLAGGKYLVETDYLNYNSKDEAISFDNLILRPGTGTKSRIVLGLDFPKVSLKGVDIEEFVFDNVLNLQKLEVNKGTVEVGIDRQVTSQKTKRKSAQAVQKAIDWVKIDTILATESFLQLNFLGQNNSRKSVETEFGFMIQDFHLDSLVLDKSELNNLYSAASLDLKNFIFALPDSVHTVSFSNVQLADSQHELLFSNLEIVPIDHVGQVGKPVIEAKIDQLAIVNNHLPEIIQTQRFDMKEVRMLNPKIDVFLDSGKAEKPQRIVKPKDAKPLVESIVLGDFEVVNGDIQFHFKEKGPIKKLDLNQLNFRVEDLELDFLDQDQELDLKDLVSKDLAFSVSDYHLETPDSLYSVSFDKISYQNGGLLIEGIYHRPKKGNYALLRSMPYQTDAVTARIDRLSLEGLQPEAYLTDKKFVAKVLEIDGAKIDLFRDKRIPADTSVVKAMPQFLMNHAKIDADIDAIKVRDGRVRYFEFAPKGNLPGMISFDQVELEMAPFYLRRKEEEYPVDTVLLGIQAKVMNESQVQLQSLMYFKDKYPMDVSVSMDSFSFSEANDFLSKTLFVKAVSGQVSEGKWNFRLNEDYAIGEMAFGYTDLKIQFVDSLTFERGLGKLKIYSFGANLLAKNNNPRGTSKKTLKREIFQERDKRKFVFSAWWKATFSGLRGTFGLGRPKVPKWLKSEVENTD